GEGEDVVGVVVGQVHLEQVEVLVDGLRQPELAGERVDGSDAAAGDAPGPGGGLVVDVGGGEDRLGGGRGDRAIEPASDFALAGGVVAVWNRLHSKSPRDGGRGICVPRSNVPAIPGEFQFY